MSLPPNTVAECCLCQKFFKSMADFHLHEATYAAHHEAILTKGIMPTISKRAADSSDCGILFPQNSEVNQQALDYFDQQKAFTACFDEANDPLLKLGGHMDTLDKLEKGLTSCR